MGLRGPQPKAQVCTEWSSELAYAVGLIATDGCLLSDGRHIDFTSKDVQLLRLFKKCLKLEHIKIGFKTSGYSGKIYPRVQFGDVNFYKWLQQIGLSQRKSKTISRLEIPPLLFFDFLRGCFDGDGTIYSFWDKRWAHSFMFYIAFASASHQFLLWLQETVETTLGFKGHIASAARGSFQLKYAKKDSIALFQKMFYASEVPCLKRKFLKARRIFAENKKASEHDAHARVVKLANTPL